MSLANRVDDLDWSDFFAGGGGSSTGMMQVPGVKVRVAANHDQLACDVHQMNHPDTDHACVDLHLEDPRYFPRTLLGWFSPERAIPGDPPLCADHLIAWAVARTPPVRWGSAA